MKPLPHIRAMSPYALADMCAPTGVELLSLSQNESLRGPAPEVIAAATRALACGADYPDPDWSALRKALAHLHDIAAEQILCGAGSLDLIGCLARTYCSPDRAVLAPEHAYPFFRTAAEMANARFDVATEQNMTVSVDSLLQAVQPDTAVVFVANPGNPTGTHLPKSELLRLRRGLRDDILLVIDEAYGEFIDAQGDRSWDMVASGNCVVLRTFSKAFAMAGFRVGWGLFPPQVAAQLRKVMNPNGVSSVAQAAARAAIEAQDYMIETCAITAALRSHSMQALSEAGLHCVPSATNFILIRFDSADHAISADAALRSQGVFLRRQQGAGLPHCLRMTIGPAAALEKAVGVLKAWKQEAGP